MNRDTKELPAIMSEMERDMQSIKEFWYDSFIRRILTYMNVV